MITKLETLARIATILAHLGEDSEAIENGYEIPAEPSRFFALVLDGDELDYVPWALNADTLEAMAKAIDEDDTEARHYSVFDLDEGPSGKPYDIVHGVTAITRNGQGFGITPELPEDAPEFTFEGITITLKAVNAPAAYSALCELLAAHSNLEYTTDTYSGPGVENADTDELFPCDCGRPRVMCATFDSEEAEHTDRFPEPEDADTLTDEALIAGGVSAVALEVLADHEAYGKDWEMRREITKTT